MYRLLLLLIICPGLYSQDLGKILWGETPLNSPLNFDFISSKSNNSKVIVIGSGDGGLPIILGNN